LRWWFAAWVLCAVVMIGAPVHAQVAGDVALVTIAADDARAQALGEVIDELLGRLQLHARTQRVDAIDLDDALKPRKTAAVARIWIEWRGDPKLYLSDGATERVLFRQLATDDRSDELLREELGLIIWSALETLRAGAEVGAPRALVREQLGLPVELPEPAPPKPPAPRTPRPIAARAPPAATPPSFRVGGRLFYEGQGYAAEQVLVHGPGAALEVHAAALTLSPGASFEAQYRLPFERIDELAGFELQSVALRLLAHVDPLHDPLLVFRTHLGLSVETLILAPLSVSDGAATPSQARARAAPLPRFGAALHILMFGDTALVLGFSGDIDVIGTRYVLQQGDTLIPLVEPLRVRPSVSVGLGTTFAGAALFDAP
jgi:hypothetical protein